MKKLYLCLIIVSLIGLIVLSQYFFDREKKSFSASAGYQPLVATPSALLSFNLGLKPVLADYYWLSAIQYYGGGRRDGNYQKLADYLELTTELDPKFVYPYAFAALILPGEKVDDGYKIAQKGIDRGLNDWQIPYYLAASYHVYKHDKQKAAVNFDLATQTPGAPDNLKLISAAYNSRPDNRSTALAIWQGIFENSSDDTVKNRAKDYIYHFQLMDFYDQAAIKYQQKTGSFPKTPADLVSSGILTAIPPDPFGLDFVYDAQGLISIKSE